MSKQTSTNPQAVYVPYTSHRNNHRKRTNFFRFFHCFVRLSLPSTSQNFNFAKLVIFRFYPPRNADIPVFDTGPRRTGVFYSLQDRSYRTGLTGPVTRRTVPADLFRFGAAVRRMRTRIFCFSCTVCACRTWIFRQQPRNHCFRRIY